MDALPDGRRVIHFDDDGLFAQGVVCNWFAKIKLEIRADVPHLDQQRVPSLYFEYDKLRKVWIAIISCLNINPYQFDFTRTNLCSIELLQLDSPTPKNSATLQLSPFYIHFWFVERWCCRDSVTGWSRMAGASVSLDLPSGVLCVSSTREQRKRDRIGIFTHYTAHCDLITHWVPVAAVDDGMHHACIMPQKTQNGLGFPCTCAP